MDHDALFLCRMMMRFYSLLQLGEEGDRVSVEPSKPELWMAYRAVELKLFPAFEQMNIHPTPVCVTSDFNGRVKKVMELVFCNRRHTVGIPREIYGLFADYGKENFFVPAEPPVLRFGYTGRCYDYKTKTRLVTDGLQVGSLGKIVLDLFSLEKMSRDGISCRLTHELLHVFGVSEEEMTVYKPKAFLALRDRMDALSGEIQEILLSVRDDFLLCAARLAEENPDCVAELERLGNALYLQGFPAKPEEVLHANVMLPEGVTSKNTVDWRLREVLFM